MRNDFLHKFLIILLFTSLVSACTIPSSTGDLSLPTGQPSATFLATTALPTEAQPFPVQATSTSEMSIEPTLLPAATSTHLPTFTAEASQIVDPYLVTLRRTEARVGPGFDYEHSHSLEEATLVHVQGRSADGQWWAIPGPGDGPGPLSWIQAADVDFFGEAGTVPVLSPPSGGRTDVPIHSDPGFPPTNVCTITPLGSDLEPVYIRLGPGEQFNVIYRLGGWAEVLKTEIGWHMILLGPGEVGWVQASRVETSGPCP